MGIVSALYNTVAALLVVIAMTSHSKPVGIVMLCIAGILCILGFCAQVNQIIEEAKERAEQEIGPDADTGGC